MLSHDQISELENMLGARVKKGVNYLDARHPQWLEIINVDVLDLEHGCSCVLGQLAADIYNEEYDYADYGVYTAEHGLRTERATEMGFFLPDEQETSMFTLSHITVSTYKVLTSIWKQEIKRLREERVSCG